MKIKSFIEKHKTIFETLTLALVFVLTVVLIQLIGNAILSNKSDTSTSITNDTGVISITLHDEPEVPKCFKIDNNTNTVIKSGVEVINTDEPIPDVESTDIFMSDEEAEYILNSVDAYYTDVVNQFDDLYQ